MTKSDDVNYGCGTPTPCVGLTSNTLPEEKQSYSGNCSQVGVSTHNVLNRSTHNTPIGMFFALRMVAKRKHMNI